MAKKTELIIFLKDVLCRLVCDPSIDVCGYFTNIADSKFYILCRENGYQMDIALSEIVDELFVDEDYIQFTQVGDFNDKKLDNFFTYVITFVGFFMIHNVHPDCEDELKSQFIKLYIQ